jgi:hypothetical protein
MLLKGQKDKSVNQSLFRNENREKNTQSGGITKEFSTISGVLHKVRSPVQQNSSFIE